MAEQFSITLGDERWKVMRLEKPPKVKGEDCYGYCKAGRREIGIWKGVPEDKWREIFIHELLHALFWHYDEEWIETVAEQVDDALTAFEEFDKGTEG